MRVTGMPGIRTQPTSRTLGQAGRGEGARAPCRHAGTRACLSREGRAGQKSRSLSPLFPLSCFLSPPVEALPLGAQPLQALGWKGQEGLRSDPEYSPGESCQ